MNLFVYLAIVAALLAAGGAGGFWAGHSWRDDEVAAKDTQIADLRDDKTSLEGQKLALRVGVQSCNQGVADLLAASRLSAELGQKAIASTAAERDRWAQERAVMQAQLRKTVAPSKGLGRPPGSGEIVQAKTPEQGCIALRGVISEIRESAGRL